MWQTKMAMKERRYSLNSKNWGSAGQDSALYRKHGTWEYVEKIQADRRRLSSEKYGWARKNQSVNPLQASVRIFPDSKIFGFDYRSCM